MRFLRLSAPAAVVFPLVLFASGVLTQRSEPGLPVTPFLTLLLVPVLRACMFICGAVAMGGVLLGGVLGDEARAIRIAVRSSLAYAGVSAALSVATLADVLASQWWQALTPRMLFSFMTQIDEGRYFMLQVVLGCSAALILQRVQHRIDAVFALVVLMAAVALPGFSGHSAAAASHWIASATMILHLEGVSLWVGGVIALAATREVRSLASFSTVALFAYAMLVIGGVADLLARIGSWADFWSDPYSLVLGVKIVLVWMLGVLGYRQRRRIAEGVEVSNALILRTLRVEVSLMLLAMAFAVTLARMANP